MTFAQSCCVRDDARDDHEASFGVMVMTIRTSSSHKLEGKSGAPSSVKRRHPSRQILFRWRSTVDRSILRDFRRRALIAGRTEREGQDRPWTNFQKVLQGFSRGNVFPERLISHIIRLASLVFSFPFRITPNHRHLLPDAVVSPLCARRSPAVPTAHPCLSRTLEHSHAGRSRPSRTIDRPLGKG